jgi:hypothetical protein
VVVPFAPVAFRLLLGRDSSGIRCESTVIAAPRKTILDNAKIASSEGGFATFFRVTIGVNERPRGTERLLVAEVSDWGRIIASE